MWMDLTTHRRADIERFAAALCGENYARLPALITEREAVARIVVANNALVVLATNEPTNDDNAIMLSAAFPTLLHKSGSADFWFKRIGLYDIAGSVQLWHCFPR